MKKFTSILLLLLMYIGASWAQVLPVAGKFYRIKDVANSKYLTIQNYDVHDKGANGGVPVLVEDPDNADQVWEFVETSTTNEYMIKSKSGYYITLREWNVDATAEGTAVTIEEVDEMLYMKWYNTYKNAEKYLKVGPTSSGTGVYYPYGDADDSGKASWSLVEVTKEELNRIDALMSSALILSEARGFIADTKIVGKEAYTDVTSLQTALSAYEEEQTADNLEKIQTELNRLKENGTKATVTLLPGEKFTLKCIEDARGYLVYSTVEGKGSETEPWVAGTGYSSQPDNVNAEGVYKEWTYVTVGENQYLFNVQKKMSVATTSGEPVVFANRGTAFELISGVDGVSNIKMGNGYLASAASWNGNHPVRKTGMDNGARFYIEKVGISVEDALLSEMTLAATYGSVDEWKNDQLAVLGYVGGYAKSEQSNIESITDFAGIEAFVTGNHEVVEPVDGGYYFVQTAKNQSAGQGMYMSYTGTDCRVYQLGEGEKPGIQHVWQFDAPADGGFKLKSCNLGAYLQTGVAPAASTIVADMDNGYKYNFIVNAGAEITIKDGNDKVLRTEGASENYKVNQWTNNTDATWYIIPAEDIYVTLSAEDTNGAWATAYLPFGVDLPAENLKAYAVTATENGSATLAEVTNIPANQGVILNGTVGEHHLTINKDAAWSGVDNKLRGTNVSIPVSEPSYVLAKPEAEVGLYKAVMIDGSWLNNSNKAYLPANEVTADAPFLIFDFGTETAIEGVAAKDAGKAVIYDLSGRRVKGAQKGIYIINGKKVVK